MTILLVGCDIKQIPYLWAQRGQTSDYVSFVHPEPGAGKFSAAWYLLAVLRALALIAILAGPASSIWAAPTIDVRARTRIVIDDIARTHAGVHVRGTLLDASTGAGVAAHDVLVRGEDRELRVTTNASGRFDAVVALSQGSHELGVSFTGDTIYDASASDSRRVDVGKAPLTLALHGPPELDTTAKDIEISVEAAAPGGPESVPVTLRAGDATGELRQVGRLTTGADGIGKLVIARDKLGKPGEKRLVARFAGDDVLDEATAEATFVLFTATQLVDLKSPVDPVRYEDDVDVAGRLVDAQRQPVTGVVVGLVRGGKHDTDAVTGNDGGFRLRVSASDLGPGPATFTVDFASTQPWRRGTKSGPITVEVMLAQPAPLAPALLAFLVTALAVLAFVLGRTTRWRALFRWRRPLVVPAAVPEVDAAPAPGLVLARPGIMSSFRRAHDHVFSGRVVDVTRGVAVAGARLAIGETALVSDADGGFSVELLPGSWRVEVRAPGYMTCVVNVTAPHHGELRGARVDLLPVRERVFAVYREVAARLLPSPDLWGIWTPREILDHTQRKRGVPALAEFTSSVEEICFSERVPDEAVVDAVQTRAGAARTELGH
jgi:hypothetical protein